MAKYKLAISIPTYERPDCIKKLVDYMIDEAERLKVGIYVFDGSEQNNETYEICKKYEKYSCFHYIKHSGTVAQRHCEAIYKPDCEYLWLSRDRTILKTDFWSLFLTLFEANYDLYIIADNRLEDHVKIYENPQKLIVDFIFSMTFFGSYIVKKDFIQQIEETNDNYLSNFPLVYKVFASAANKSDFKALYTPFRLHCNYFHIHENLRAEHTWGKRFLTTWAKNWSLLIEALPSYYDEQKSCLKLILSKDLCLWSFFGFLNLCRWGGVKIKDLYEYKKYIIQVTTIPWSVMVFFVALPRFITHTIREIVRPFLRFYYHRKEHLYKKEAIKLGISFKL